MTRTRAVRNLRELVLARRHNVLGVAVPGVIVAGLTACGSGTAGGTTGTSSSSSSTHTCATGTRSSPGAVNCGGAGAIGTPTPTSTGTTFTVDGAYQGQTVSGTVKVFEAPTCGPISSEGSTGVEVIWDGTVQGTAPTANKEISGNLSIYKLGSWELPSTDMLAPVGSLVYAGNEATKLALTSGTLSATAGYGTIDAKFINGGDTLHLQGTWFCAA